MKHKLLYLFIACMACACQVNAQSAKYVILISIDGSRPDFYMQEKWPATNLKQLKDNGVFADGVNSVFPSVTYPSHTTIITGAMPSRHGIYYNEPFDPNGPQGRWYWEDSNIKCPTLWQAVHKAGLTCAAVSWPVTVGAPIDYNVPEIWSLTDKEDKISPMRDHTFPKDLWAQMEQHATGKLTSADMDENYLTKDENIGRKAAYILRTYKPNLLAVHFVCVDHFEHAEGRDGINVKKAVENADDAVGKILEAVQQAGIKDSTAIIITGDHGFVNIATTVCPNVWLAKNNLVWKKDGKVDYKAMFHTSGAAAFLRVQDKNDKKTLAQVKKILDELPAGDKKLFRIVTEQELRARGADPEVVLALAPVQGVNLSESFDGDAIKAARGGTHGFYPDFHDIQTGFIGYGAGFNKGVEIPQIGLEDIAPLIAQLLHLDFTAPDGVLLPGLLKNK